MGNYFFNEDRIDAFSTYSEEALADVNYFFSKHNRIGKPQVQMIYLYWEGTYVNQQMEELGVRNDLLEIFRATYIFLWRHEFIY